jgi:hypothetical protein
VARKLRFLASQGELELDHQRRIFTRNGEEPFQSLQTDELETLEHTKLKPVSVPLLVDAQTRFIIAIDACSMPAKGLLAMKSREKYGKRKDERRKTILRLFQRVTPFMDTCSLQVKSDSSPLYPPLIRKAWPHAIHNTVLSRKSSNGGQGELKKIGFDPIFSINHTCAMLRAHVSRLIRKTWCTTKKISALRDHLIIYAVHHNRKILAELGMS